ncbi:hypothetical protein BDQ17DRAFT_1196026, partial [Cyathus striatus]
GNRRHIPKSVKEQLVTQCKYLAPKLVARSNQVGLSTVYQLRCMYRQTGTVQRKALIVGRPRSLNALDISFLEACIQRAPDIYLEELQEELHTAHDVSVSKTAIIHAL